MQKALLFALAFSTYGMEPLSADNELPSSPASNEPAKKTTTVSKQVSLEPFTGKVTRSRVRLRLAPHLDSQVYKELDRDEMLLITGEEDDFFSVIPPQEVKGYVFRTYVLDGIVEGNHVNVRLEPDTTAPILTQLNNGDRIEGVIAPNNTKWLQIQLPEDARFYVAKEFVTKIGNKNLFASLQKRKEELNKSLSSIEAAMQQELQKPFSEIAIAPIANRLNNIISNNQDLPQQTEKAKDLLHHLQEIYLAKSVSNNASYQRVSVSHTQKETPTQQAISSDAKIASSGEEKAASKSQAAPFEQVDWSNKETDIIECAIEEQQATSTEDFYAHDREKAQSLRGIIKPYERVVKNRPGDFVLVDPKTGIAFAYLYSTQCPLKEYIGKEITVVASPRPNNYFAFPAYFVYHVQ